MKISRSDNLYIEIDKIENHSIQYQIFLEMIRLRYFFNYDAKKNQDRYIRWAKIRDIDVVSHSNDREMFTMKCESDLKIITKERFIMDYSYFNDVSYQVWVNIDLSLPKEMIIAQIAQLKDDADRGKEIQTFLKSSYNSKITFIPHIPSEFSKIIKRNYGDFLFVIDCKELGYKNQDIIYSIFEHREYKNTLSPDTIRKYMSITKELYTFIEQNQ